MMDNGGGVNSSKPMIRGVDFNWTKRNVETGRAQWGASAIELDASTVTR